MGLKIIIRGIIWSVQGGRDMQLNIKMIRVVRSNPFKKSYSISSYGFHFNDLLCIVISSFVLFLNLGDTTRLNKIRYIHTPKPTC